MGNRIFPDNNDGFHLPDGGRAIPDGNNGFHLIPGSGGGLSAGEGLLMGLFMAIAIPAMIIVIPPAISYFIFFVVIAGLTTWMLGRPLTPLEYGAVTTQGLVVTIIFWLLIAIFFLWRRSKK